MLKRENIIRVLTVITITTFFACSSTKKVETIATETGTDNMEIINTSVIAESNNGGFVEKMNRIITNIDDLDKAWGKAFVNYERKKPIPVIDFEKQVVLLVAMGEKSNGGYSIKVGSVTNNTKNTVVTVLETIPGESCPTPSVMSYPYQLVLMPKQDSEVIFKTIEKVYDCEE